MVEGERSAFELVGWQVGLSYETPRREGLSKDYLLRLLDEMATQRMNLLSLVMVSQAYHDPLHDGYTWPVQDPSLRCYLDEQVTNARPEGEFVSEIIEEAAQRGIAIQLFLQGPWWNAPHILQGFPDAHPVVDAEGHAHTAYFCLDSPGAWRACLGEALDLLRYYDHPNVRSYAVEMIGLERCYCPYSRARFRDEFGSELEDTAGNLVFGMPVEVWNINRTRDLLGRYVAAIHQVRPDIEVWVHTQGGQGRGHAPHIFAPAGIPCLLPLDHFYTAPAQAHHLLQYLAPNPCIVHLCGRTRQPLNYPLPAKTPELVREKIGWYARYGGENLRGLLFFNEVVVPPEIKGAIYQKLTELRER